MIDYPNGIDKKEAIILAKKYFVENGLNSDYYENKVFKVEEGDWVEEKDLWIIYFKPKKTFNGHRVLTIDKKTGKVVDRGRSKW